MEPKELFEARRKVKDAAQKKREEIFKIKDWWQKKESRMKLAEINEEEREGLLKLGE